MSTQQVIPTSCPACRAQFNTPYQSIIDGQQEPIKLAFLNGRLNVTQCSQCGAVFPVDAPILYYDLDKELALAYVPGGLNVSVPEQEKVVGKLTDTLMRQLEPEQKKFYLFNPKLFLKIESLVEAVLDADGITADVRAKQQARMTLLQEFLQLETEQALRDKATAQAEELDREFFNILTALMHGAYTENNQGLMQALMVLRGFLTTLSAEYAEIVESIDAELGIVILKDRDDLLKRLRNAQNEEELASLIELGHAMLDYTFFQSLTAEIEQSDAPTAEQLKDLRRRILDAKADYEQRSAKALERSTRILQNILRAQEPQKVIASHLDQIDESFFALLSAQIQQAQQQNNNEAAQVLESVGKIVFSMLQEREMANQQQSSPAAEPPAAEPPPSSTIEIATR